MFNHLFNPNEGMGGFNPGYYAADCIHPVNFSWTRQSRFVGPSDPVVETIGEVPIAVNHNLFVINKNGDLIFGGDGGFYCLTPQGKVKWCHHDKRNILYRLTYGSPIILRNGYVLTGTSGAWGSKGHRLIAIDNEGQIVWEYLCDDGVSSSFATDENGTIYFTTFGSKLHAVDQGGLVKWVFKYDVESSSTPVITKDGHVLVASNDGTIFILNQHGEVTDKFRIGVIGAHPMIMIDQSGKLYVNSNLNGRMELLSIGLNGRIHWAFRPRKGDIATSPSMNKEGYLFVGATYFQLFCVNQEGKEVWNAKVEGLMSHPPIIDRDGNVYTVSYKDIRGKRYSYLQSFHENGEPRWTIQVKGGSTLPVISETGEIFLLSHQYNGLQGITQISKVKQKHTR